MRVICGVLRRRAELSITSASLLHHSELVLAVSPRCPRALYSLLELPLLPLPLQSLSWDRSWGLGLGYGGPVLPSLPDSAFGDTLCLFNPSWFLLRAGSTAGLRHGFPRAPQGMRMLCKPPPEPGFAVCALSPGKGQLPDWGKSWFPHLAPFPLSWTTLWSVQQSPGTARTPGMGWGTSLLVDENPPCGWFIPTAQVFW